MNIKLNNTEAVDLLQDHFRRTGLFVSVQPLHITIESAANPADHDKKTVELTPLIRAIKNTTPFIGIGSPKIAAIKAVRAAAESQGVFVGLVDAKLFVEQFIP